MTLDGHLLLSHPAESWPVCTPPECVSASVCTSPFTVNCLCWVTVFLCLRGGLFVSTCICIMKQVTRVRYKIGA